MKNSESTLKLQSSFELLVTLSFGLAILLPLIVLAFIQLASANSSLAAIESQQAASKIASIASLVGSEGPPAKQVIQIQMPPGVQNIYIGTLASGIGHEVIFAVRAPTGLSYVTSYTPVNVSGSLASITSTGTYLINITAQSKCPGQLPVPCVYITSTV